MNNAPKRRWMPERDQILASRWLRPVRPYLSDDSLWDLNRGSVARGVAVGLFIGLLLPVAQFLFAIAGAVLLRGHVPVSAACTLVTNPLTVTPIYWLAFQIGGYLLPARTEALDTLQSASTWFAQAVQWAGAMGAPLLTGLAVMASVTAALGYVVVWLLWPRPAAPVVRDRGRD
jgi:hypothetical protein